MNNSLYQLSFFFPNSRYLEPLCGNPWIADRTSPWKKEKNTCLHIYKNFNRLAPRCWVSLQGNAKLAWYPTFVRAQRYGPQSKDTMNENQRGARGDWREKSESVIQGYCWLKLRIARLNIWINDTRPLLTAHAMWSVVKHAFGGREPVRRIGVSY